jgi:hypothetical protein
MTKVIRGGQPAVDLLTEFIFRQSGCLPDALQREELGKILPDLCRELFIESYSPSPSSRDKAIGDFAIGAVTVLSEEENIIGLLGAGLEFHHIPTLNVYGQIERKYVELLKSQLELDQLGGA